MQTLTEYQYLDKDFILKGIANWMVKESPILKVMPQKSVQGNAYLYNVSTALPLAQWSGVGDPISESTGTFEQRTTSIYTLIQNAYTDKSQIALNSTQDPEAIDAELAAQAMAYEWEKTFIIGQTSVDSNAKQFKGLLRIIAELEGASKTDLDGAVAGTGNNSQVIVQHATSAALTTAQIDVLIDAVKPGKPDVLMTSRLTRRKLNALQRATGNSGTLNTNVEKFGIFMPAYDEIPLFISDWVPDNLPNASSSVVTISTYDYDATRTTDLDNSIIFAFKTGEAGVMGLQAGQMSHERKTLVEGRNAILNRYIMYTSIVCTKKFGLACLTAFDPDA